MSSRGGGAAENCEKWERVKKIYSRERRVEKKNSSPCRGGKGRGRVRKGLGRDLRDRPSWIV